MSRQRADDSEAFQPPGQDVRFRVLADLMPQIVWAAEPGGQVNYANGRWEALSGQPFLRQGEALLFETYVHPDDRSAWEAAWHAACGRQSSFEVMARLCKQPEGEWCPYLHHAVAMRDEKGKIVQWIGTSTAIGEPPDTHRAQDLHAMLEERSTAALALSDHLLVAMRERSDAIAELEARMQHLSQVITTQSQLVQAELDLESFMAIVVERMLILTPAAGSVIELVNKDEMIYRAASGVVCPYLGLRLKCEGSLSGLCVRLSQTLETPDTQQDPRVDAEACRKVGAVSMVVAPLLDRGRAVGVLKILSDRPNAFSRADVQTVQLMAGLIGAALGHQQQFERNQQLLAERTEALDALAEEVERRRHSEETLRASEERMRLIIESSGEAFLAISNDGVVTHWNRQAEVMFGWLDSEILGQRPEARLIPASEHARFSRALRQARRQPEKVQRFELAAQTRDRGVMSIEMVLSGLQVGEACLFSAFLHDVSERKRREGMLRHLAEHDGLTGLLNRRALEAKIAMLDSEHAEMPCALLFLDLDGFKAVNDQFGHDKGDVLLKQVAQRLQHCVRETDTLARLGGDEFVVLLVSASLTEQDVCRVAQAVVDQIAKPYLLDSCEARVSASVGVALRARQQALSGTVLMQQADEAMYAAKHEGKNRYQLWRPQMHTADKKR